MWFDRVFSFFSWLESETQKLHSVNFWSNRPKAPKSNLLSLMKILGKEQLVRSKSCHFYFLSIALLQSTEFLSINEPVMENRCLCSFKAPSRFTLNENCNWIDFFQIVAHQWIKFLYRASEEQKWIWYFLLKDQSYLRSLHNLKFESGVRFTYFQLDYELKGLLSWSWKSVLQKTHR